VPGTHTRSVEHGLYLRGRYDEAAIRFREAIRVDHDSVYGHLNLASILAGTPVNAECISELRYI
jgi:hypothetical protein